MIKGPFAFSISSNFFSPLSRASSKLINFFPAALALLGMVVVAAVVHARVKKLAFFRASSAHSLLS